MKVPVHLMRYYGAELNPLLKLNHVLGSSSKEISCKSQKLLLKHGLIQGAGQGLYYFLPPLVRAMDKLINLIDKEMKKIGGEKIFMPSLSPSHLWKTSGRWESIGNELYTLKDRNGLEFCLSPTHEEAIAELVSHHHAILSYKNFPMKFYQITTKFRDEMRPKFGLLRGKEFIMKDMYTFDTSENNAKMTYDQVCTVYENIFKKLGIYFIKVEGSPGNMGGSITHEFHFLAERGEDELLICKKCNTGLSAEVANGKTSCKKCNSEMDVLRGIEIAHAFLLNETYSKLFETCYKTEKGTFELLQMGCFGLGISRLLAASVEVLSSDEFLKWPLLIAPYIVCVITPKSGSKEEPVRQFSYDLARSLNELSHLRDNIIMDDRTQFTIGYRIRNAKEAGLPYLVVVGGKAMNSLPKIEVHNIYQNEVSILTHAETMDYFRKLSKIL